MIRNLHRRVEEGILLGVILLNIGDFLGMLSGDLALIKLLISWAALAYLVFQVGLTKVIFNNERVGADIVIITSYIFLISKNLVEYSHDAIHTSEILAWFYSFIIDYGSYIIFYPFILGCTALIIVSAYLALKVEIRKPSLLHIVHEDGRPPKDPLNLFFRFVVILATLSGFFIVVFNLIMEWLAMITDSPLIMFAILFYLFIIIRHHKRFTAESLLHRIGKFGEDFYSRFLTLFRYKKTVLLGISGLLVLHLLTEIQIFLFPYIFGLREISYLASLDGMHLNLYTLFMRDLSILQTSIDAVPLAAAYVMNLAAMVFLLFMPAFIWYMLYEKKGFRLKTWFLGAFFSSVTGFLLLNSFSLKAIRSGSVAGVDIVTKSVYEGLPGRAYLYAAVIVALLIGFIIMRLSRTHSAKEKLIATGIIAIDLFFTAYIFLFSASVVRNYLKTISDIMEGGFPAAPFVAFFMGMFLLITLLFYIGGFIIFILETRKEFRYVK